VWQVIWQLIAKRDWLKRTSWHGFARAPRRAESPASARRASLYLHCNSDEKPDGNLAAGDQIYRNS